MGVSLGYGRPTSRTEFTGAVANSLTLLAAARNPTDACWWLTSTQKQLLNRDAVKSESVLENRRTTTLQAFYDELGHVLFDGQPWEESLDALDEPESAGIRLSYQIRTWQPPCLRTLLSQTPHDRLALAQSGSTADRTLVRDPARDGRRQD